MSMKKKILAIFMILMMSFCLFACGDDDTPQTDADDILAETDGEDAEGGDTEEGDVEYIFPEVNDDDEEYYDDGEPYDLGIKAVKSFAMSATLDKISYSDISSAGDGLQSKLESAFAKTGLGDFVIAFNDYEEDDEYEIDKLTYVAAMEDDDMDKAIVELGVYHNASTDKYYQYNGYTSETLTSADASVKEILADIESAYGVKLSKSKVQKALKAAWKEAASIEDYYGVYERTTFDGDGYSDSIIVRVDVGYDEDDEMGAYIYVERERLYS